MARKTRCRSILGIEHVVVQSYPDKPLWQDPEEKEKYLSVLLQVGSMDQVLLMGYVLMDSFAHLCLEAVGKMDLSAYMRHAHTIYSRWFRKRHGIDKGTKLFRDRFKSEAIKSEPDLLMLIRQIHRIPESYGFSMETYPYSSFQAYTKGKPGISVRKVLEALHYSGSVETYMLRQDASMPMLREKPIRYGRSDEEATKIFESYMGGRPIRNLMFFPEEEKRALIRKVRKQEGISILQLSRITGVSRGIIQRL